MPHVGWGTCRLLKQVVLDEDKFFSSVSEIIIGPAVTAPTLIARARRMPIVPYLDVVGSIGCIARSIDVVEGIVVNESEKLSVVRPNDNIFYPRNGIEVVVVKPKGSEVIGSVSLSSEFKKWSCGSSIGSKSKSTYARD